MPDQELLDATSWRPWSAPAARAQPGAARDARLAGGLILAGEGGAGAIRVQTCSVAVNRG